MFSRRRLTGDFAGASPESGDEKYFLTSREG